MDTGSTDSREARGDGVAPRDMPDTAESLNARARTGSLWTFGGYGTSEVIRFGSNLILTRMLFPEVFGIMAIVHVLMQGLLLFSDMGLGPAIIQNRRGEEHEFLRTAWSIHVLRGLALFIIMSAMAWPIAAFYGEPIYRGLIPVVAMATAIDGFKSMNFFLLRRRMRFEMAALLDLAPLIVSIALTIALATIYKSVWVLVVGRLANVAVMVAITHLALGPPKMRFTMNKKTAIELLHFGKWIFLSSIFAFIVTRIDRLVLPKFMTMAEFGVYWIAFRIGNAAVEGVVKISAKVLFPVYARMAEGDRAELRRGTFRARRTLMLAALPVVCLLVVWGREVVEFLYDDRYIAAGPMVQVLALAAVFHVVFEPVGSVLLAVGDSYRHMLLQLTRSIVIITCISVGGYVGGAMGIIWGYAASSVLYYPILARFAHRYRVWLPLLDAAGVGLAFAAIGLGLLVRAALGG